MSLMDTLIELDVDAAETFMGPEPGRPTISTRLARPVAHALNVREGTAKGIVHGILLVGAGALVAKAANVIKTWF